MPPRRGAAPDPGLLVVDASTFFDEVFGRDPAADGLIEALAEACFRFAFDAKLKGEYKQLDHLPNVTYNLFQVRRRLFSKGVPRVRAGPSLPRTIRASSWDPDDDHLLTAAIASGAGRIVTSERRNLNAAGTVRAQLGVEVVDNAEAARLALRRCP